VAAEGHPIAPGTTGENLTIEGFDVSLLPIGTRLAIGEEVVLELASAADPCRTIRHSFGDHRYGRLGRSAHVADSRMYSRVVREGSVRPGDPIVVVAPDHEGAARFADASRLDRAVRSASLSLWRAAAEGGAPVAILDDGDVAAAACGSLPGRTFNQAIGFAHLPNLVGMAIRHFTEHGAIGWVWADEQPWAGAVAEGEAVHATGQPSDLVASAAPERLVIRELSRTEVGPWAEVMIAANRMPPAFAVAWRAMERGLALAPHDHRFLGEIDGSPVAAGAIHTHHGVGYLRAGSVLPDFRGRGIQRALIAARVIHAARLGCDLVGSIADAESSSARNLERSGLRVVAVRRAYRVDPGD
jgi:GNAT superfamily N-acetyltransferase